MLFLEQLGFKVNTELKVLVCMTCEQAIPPGPKAVETHFNNKHLRKGRTMEKFLRGSRDELKNSLSTFKFAVPSEVKVQPDSRAPVPGIKVERGFYCPVADETTGLQCLHTYGQTSSLETHIWTEHQGNRGHLDTLPLENYPCDYQTLFAGNLRHFFRVSTGLSPGTKLGGSQDPYSTFIRQTASKPSDAYRPEPIKNAELPSLLRATKWNVFLEPYRADRLDIVSLISSPSTSVTKMAVGMDQKVEEVLRGLSNVCNAWLDKVKFVLHEGSGDYVRRILAECPM